MINIQVLSGIEFIKVSWILILYNLDDKCKYNSIPQITEVNITTRKDIAPNEPLADRINPEITKAFQENPYTQSLNSWA